MKWSIGRVFVQNVPTMAVRYPQDAVSKAARTGMLECGTLPCRHSRIVPVKGHDEYYKGGTARVFALCAEKERLSVQRAFHLYEGGTHEQRIK